MRFAMLHSCQDGHKVVSQRLVQIQAEAQASGLPPIQLDTLRASVIQRRAPAAAGSESSSSSSQDSSTATAIIVCCAVAGAVLLALAACALVGCLRHRRRRERGRACKELGSGKVR